MGTPLSLLIVEDSASDAALIVRRLQQEGFDVADQRVESAGEMRAALGERAWDLVLSDFKVPGFGAGPALALLHETGLDLPFILVSGTIGDEAAVELMKAGAHDYVMKDHMARLGAVVRREIAEAGERRERLEAEKALRESEERFRGLVEQSLVGIFITDGEYLRYCNPRTEEIAGYQTGELAGVRLEPLVADADYPAVAGEIRRLMRGEVDIAKLEFRARRKDGGEVTIGAQGLRARFESRQVIVGMLQDISEKRRAEDEIKRYIAELENAFTGTVAVTMSLSEMHDPYTAGHERRVAEIAVALGAELGFDARRQEGLRVAGQLHDLGKIVIPAEILSKPGKLSAIEFQLVQSHAQASYDVLKDVRFPWPIAEIALQHHERMDGSGYPRGCKGDAILIEARVIAVADVVEAMASHRPYRPALGIDAALAEIERGRGGSYDSEVADVCLKLFREKGHTIPA